MASLERPRGHDTLLERLAGACDRGRLAHALLFAGPDGVGKALAARWLAARIVCAADRERPCAACSACLQVAAGSHPDLHVLEVLEGKKEIGIDAVRQLRRFVNLTPGSAHRKIGIIDEADKLSVAAQNALLKTLEEPPPDSTLILVTARPGALLPTVRSRVQRILFSPLPADIVVAVLREAGVPAAEARTLSGISEGSPGRALALRALISSRVSDDLRRLLADLHPARYLPASRLASALGKTEQDMTARLELLLFHYRDRAAAHAQRGERRAAERAVRGACLVADALSTLRRRNPNRPLLAEALVIRLARLLDEPA